MKKKSIVLTALITVLVAGMLFNAARIKHSEVEHLGPVSIDIEGVDGILKVACDEDRAFYNLSICPEIPRNTYSVGSTKATLETTSSRSRHLAILSLLLLLLLLHPLPKAHRHPHLNRKPSQWNPTIHPRPCGQQAK